MTSEPTPRFLAIFREVFEDLPRQGSGNRASAARAAITAIDCRTPSVERLRTTVAGLGLTERVRPVVSDIGSPAMSPGSIDDPAMGRVSGVLAAIGRAGLVLVGRFTLPDEAWRDDFCTPMERRGGQTQVGGTLSD